MALADLLSALEAEAAGEAERLRAETEAEAAGIVESAEREARSLELRAAQAAEAELVRELEQRRSEARLAAAAALRAAREACAEALLTALRRRLDAFHETDAYPALLRALIEESLAALPDASVLRIAPRDTQLAHEVVRDLRLGLEPKPELSTAGGVEVATNDGRTVRNTLEERLRNAEPALRLLIGRLLDQTTVMTQPRQAAEELA